MFLDHNSTNTALIVRLQPPPSSKPAIKFTYGTPPLLHSAPTPTYIANIRATSPAPISKHPELPLKKTVTYCFPPPPPTPVPHHKRRIFDQRTTTLRQTRMPVQSLENSRAHSGTRAPRPRRQIFSSYERKKRAAGSLRSASGEDKCRSLYVFPKCEPPKSVVSFVDLSAMRNKKASHPPPLPASKPSLRNVTSHQRHQSHHEHRQAASPVNIDISQLISEPDPPSNQSIAVASAVEVDPFFLESDRFFDKEVPTLGKQKISYTEVSLYNTLHAQFSKEDSPAPPKSSPSLFLQTLAEMFNRAMGDKYSIPAVLILLGVLLLLIQASK